MVEMRRYAITDRKQYEGSPDEQCARLLSQAAAWAEAGVEWVQLREKDLGPPALSELAGRLVSVVRAAGDRTRILVNGPAAVAQAVQADGVHLPGASIEPNLRDSGKLAPQVGQALAVCGPGALVSVSCHTPEDAARAGEAGASVILFAPVFEKPLWGEGLRAAPQAVLEGSGLAALEAACAAAESVPVYALGGVTAENAHMCLAAGAAGVAGVRLFAGDDWLGLK